MGGCVEKNKKLKEPRTKVKRKNSIKETWFDKRAYIDAGEKKKKRGTKVP